MEWYAPVPSDAIGVASEGEPIMIMRAKAQMIVHPKAEIIMVLADDSLGVLEQGNKARDKISRLCLFSGFYAGAAGRDAADRTPRCWQCSNLDEAAINRHIQT
jgi:hypothetical protein